MDSAEDARVVDVLGDLPEGMVLKRDVRQRGMRELDEVEALAIQAFQHFARGPGSARMGGTVACEAGRNDQRCEARVPSRENVPIRIA